MKRFVAGVLAALGLMSTPASAALKVGDKAPDFTAKASLGGKDFTFSLADALKKGPVVVYFYPAAFTKGCTVEAHAFAEASAEFEALGASIIGVSNDPIETLHKFAVSECQSKFPVGADNDQSIMKAYNFVFAFKTSMANRTTYVIAPDGTILYVYKALFDATGHVEKTLDAVKQWKAKNG